MWLKPQGFAQIFSGQESVGNLDGFQRTKIGHGRNEFDTMTCGHCNRVVHVQARQRPEDIGGLCKQCMRPICPECVNDGRCVPFEKKLEEAEERDRVRRSYGL